MPPPRPLTSSSFADALGLPSAASNSAMTALYSAALGPVQLPRYLALFERFDRAGRAPIGWNSAASVLTLNWMALHFMWGAALVYLALIEGLGLVLALPQVPGGSKNSAMAIRVSSNTLMMAIFFSRGRLLAWRSSTAQAPGKVGAVAMARPMRLRISV